MEFTLPLLSFLEGTIKMSRNDPYHEMNFLRSTWNKAKAVGFNPRYFFYRIKWNLLGRYPVRTRIPIHVDIELSSSCNLKCSMCPHGEDEYEMDKGLIDYDLAKKVIKEAAEYGVTSLKFSGRGEQLLHPKFNDLVKYAKSFNFLDFIVNTNGLLLTKDKTRNIVKSGVNLVVISIDGATKETYEKIRIGADYYTLKDNLEYLLQFRKENKKAKPIVRLQFVKMKENIHEFENFLLQWKDKVDVLVGIDYSNRVAQKNKTVLARHPVGRAYCPHPWRRLMVTSSGDALMCCVDWDKKYKVGDCNKQTLKEIWNDRPIKYGRECIKKLEHHKIDSCKECFEPISYKWAEMRE